MTAPFLLDRRLLAALAQPETAVGYGLSGRPTPPAVPPVLAGSPSSTPASTPATAPTEASALAPALSHAFTGAQAAQKLMLALGAKLIPEGDPFHALGQMPLAAHQAQMMEDRRADQFERLIAALGGESRQEGSSSSDFPRLPSGGPLFASLGMTPELAEKASAQALDNATFVQRQQELEAQRGFQQDQLKINRAAVEADILYKQGLLDQKRNSYIQDLLGSGINAGMLDGESFDLMFEFEKSARSEAEMLINAVEGIQFDADTGVVIGGTMEDRFGAHAIVQDMAYKKAILMGAPLRVLAALKHHRDMRVSNAVAEWQRTPYKPKDRAQLTELGLTKEQITAYLDAPLEVQKQMVPPKIPWWHPHIQHVLEELQPPQEATSTTPEADVPGTGDVPDPNDIPDPGPLGDEDVVDTGSPKQTGVLRAQVAKANVPWAQRAVGAVGKGLKAVGEATKTQEVGYGAYGQAISEPKKVTLAHDLQMEASFVPAGYGKEVQRRHYYTGGRELTTDFFPFEESFESIQFTTPSGKEVSRVLVKGEGSLDKPFELDQFIDAIKKLEYSEEDDYQILQRYIGMDRAVDGPGIAPFFKLNGLTYTQEQLLEASIGPPAPTSDTHKGLTTEYNTKEGLAARRAQKEASTEPTEPMLLQNLPEEQEGPNSEFIELLQDPAILKSIYNTRRWQPLEKVKLTEKEQEAIRKAVEASSPRERIIRLYEAAGHRRRDAEYLADLYEKRVFGKPMWEERKRGG